MGIDKSYHSNDFSYNKFSKIPQALLNRASNATKSSYIYLNFAGNQFTEITDDVLLFDCVNLIDNQITKIAPNVLHKISNTTQGIGTSSTILRFARQTAQTETKTIIKGQTLTSQDVFPDIILQLDRAFDFVQNDIPAFLTIKQGNYRIVYLITDIMQHGLNTDQAFPQADTYQVQIKTYPAENPLNPSIIKTIMNSFRPFANTAFHTYTYTYTYTYAIIVTDRIPTAMPLDLAHDISQTFPRFMNPKL